MLQLAASFEVLRRGGVGCCRLMSEWESGAGCCRLMSASGGGAVCCGLMSASGVVLCAVGS